MYASFRPLTLALTALVALADISRAEDITVRIISAKNGHPLVERHLQLRVLYLLHAPDKYPFFLFNVWQYTDASGTTIFHVPGSLPPDASIFVGGLIDYCSPGTYRADQVQSGVAIADLRGCRHRPLKKYLVQPHPHEIVIYSGEYSRWERALYFPWPD